jgi:hypothetical protein
VSRRSGRSRGSRAWRYLALGGLIGVGSGSPQPGYQPGCFVFGESVRTTITSRSGAAAVADRAGRDGVILVTIAGRADSLALTAWYDSLSIWRETGTGREVPDVEGFLGGRYRGRLTPDGRYQATAVPFVPPEVQEVADLEPVMDDFLPRLPPNGIDPGREWSDSTGLVIKRGSDQKDPSGPIERYGWSWTHRVSDPADPADSQAVGLEQQVKDEGELRWSARFGPLGWTRQLSISAKVPIRGAVKRSVQSVVQQTITVTRLPEQPACRREPGPG